MLKIYQRCVPLLGLMCFLLAVCPAEAKQSIPATIDIPGAEGGVSFNDITYSPKLNKVIIPSGGTGQTVLIEPETGATRSVGLLRPGSTYVKGGPFQGVNSADEGEGVIFMMDRATRILSAWDIEKNEIISSTPLASNPAATPIWSSPDLFWLIFHLPMRPSMGISAEGGGDRFEKPRDCCSLA